MTQLENVQRTQPKGEIISFDNICYMSYAKLMVNEDCMEKFPYCVGDVKLCRWISTIRTKRKKPNSSRMVLDEAWIRALDSIGMRWD